MATHQEKVTAGLFLLLGIGLIFGILFLIAGISLSKGVDTFYVFFEGSIGNLRKGSEVKFQGVPVGQVDDLRLTPDLLNIEAKLGLDRGTRITQGTRALLRFNPLTSVYFIELAVDRGSIGDDLPPGCMIPQEKTEVDEFVSRLPMLQESILDVLSQVVEILSPENRAAFSSILNGMETLVNDLNTDYTSVREEGIKVGERLEKSLQTFDGTMASISRDFDRSALVFEEGVGRVVDTVTHLELKEELARVRASLEALASQYERTGQAFEGLVKENRKAVKDLLVGLEDLSRRLRSLVDTLENDPSRLIWSEEKRGRRTPD